MGGCISTKKTKVPLIFTINKSNINRYSFDGQYKYASFDNIYDGDTADIYFIENDKVIRSAFRFYGYDSAELKPLRADPNRNYIIRQAILDKEFLISQLNNKYFVVQFMKNEKYGRMMGKVWKVTDASIDENKLSTHPELTDGNQINLIMIKNGHGKPYFGGKK
jgi:endonuclease YncB( thermonuclease family)